MSIRKRGKTYHVDAYLGNGRHAYSSHPTLTAARQAEREAIAGAAGPGSGERLRDFAARWPDDYPRPKLSTQRTNESAAKRIAEDVEAVRDGNRLFVLGDLKLGAITRPQARAYCLARPHYLRAALSAMFGDAVNDGIVPLNPFARLGLPQSKGRKAIKALTEAEVELLADCALEAHAEYGPTFRAMILFSAYTGLRPGEVFGVRWGDIDFARAEVGVERRLYAGHCDLPKNGERRDVILPPPAAEALRAMPRTLSGDEVFRSKRGKPYSTILLRSYWLPVRSAFEARLAPARADELAQARGKPHLDYYELRHFCATMLLERGVDAADVALQLGHTDGGILVRRLYGHPDKAAARDRLRAAFAAPVIDISQARDAVNG